MWHAVELWHRGQAGQGHHVAGCGPLRPRRNWSLTFSENTNLLGAQAVSRQMWGEAVGACLWRGGDRVQPPEQSTACGLRREVVMTPATTVR